ncbi:MAG: polyhydroxyalkanoate synthesis regulator phasin [Candidatus Azotimanducaceae bacterium]|jgi:polyhydroxyalkanoate synthesis regulator phasin
MRAHICGTPTLICALVFYGDYAYIAHTMIDLVKKTMLAGIGMAVVTKDKVLESLDELVEKGKLTKDEAAAISDKIVEEGRNETEKAKVEASKLFNDMLHRANVVTKDQYDALAARVTALEGKLHKEFPNDD